MSKDTGTTCSGMKITGPARPLFEGDAEYGLPPAPGVRVWEAGKRNIAIGINIDWREADPKFCEQIDDLATEHGVEPLTGYFAIPVVIWGHKGPYDGTKLGKATIKQWL